MKKSRYLILALALTASLVGCKGKTATTNTAIEDSTAESDEDKFSLGGIDITVEQSATTVKKPEIKEVLETYEDGSSLVELDDGKTTITSSAHGMTGVDKLTEQESLYIDAIVGIWNTDDTLPNKYLIDNISKENFPSLSEKERGALAADIVNQRPHPNAKIEVETEAETEPPTVEVIDISEMSQEEKDQLFEKTFGGEVGHALERVEIDEELLNLQLDRN